MKFKKNEGPMRLKAYLCTTLFRHKKKLDNRNGLE